MFPIVGNSLLLSIIGVTSDSSTAIGDSVISYVSFSSIISSGSGSTLSPASVVSGVGSEDSPESSSASGIVLSSSGYSISFVSGRSLIISSSYLKTSSMIPIISSVSAIL